MVWRPLAAEQMPETSLFANGDELGFCEMILRSFDDWAKMTEGERWILWAYGV